MTALIIAIDTSDQTDAADLVRVAVATNSKVKFGLEAFTAFGPQGILALVSAASLPPQSVMIDLKINDIPTTVQRTVASMRRLSPFIITLGPDTDPAAIAAAKAAAVAYPTGARPLIACVLALTSSSDSINQDRLSRRTAQVLAAGADAVVCSALDVSFLRSGYPGLITICPGLRFATDASDDQTQIASPDEADAWGATYAIVGRPISSAASADDRLAAAITWRDALSSATAGDIEYCSWDLTARTVISLG